MIGGLQTIVSPAAGRYHMMDISVGGVTVAVYLVFVEMTEL